MKKLGRYINIAFLLIIGATFAEQINAGLDFLIDLDYNAIGNTISSILGSVVDGAVAAFDYIKSAIEGGTEVVAEMPVE